MHAKFADGEMTGFIPVYVLEIVESDDGKQAYRELGCTSWLELGICRQSHCSAVTLLSLLGCCQQFTLQTKSLGEDLGSIAAEQDL